MPCGVAGAFGRPALPCGRAWEGGVGLGWPPGGSSGDACEAEELLPPKRRNSATGGASTERSAPSSNGAANGEVVGDSRVLLRKDA
mmetsp:Transcript_48223/g.148796  ORF Transcript_48223/g.148796 Transcript_48223/m.148796 type:complete len:86 (-) Transcript_48223:544-801(-)